MYKNCLSKKIAQLRKVNFSAPTIMTVIILFFMLLIHFFEKIGILNAHRNLEHRIETPENGKDKILKNIKI